MSDDKPVPPPDEAPPEDESRPEGADAPAPDSPKAASDEEKAAKIAAAKAKAAAKKKAAEAGAPAEPKPPWEEKPVPPDHEEAADDEDAAALARDLPGAVLDTDRFAGDVTVTVPADRILEICGYLRDDRAFSFLVDLTAIDWSDRADGRFDVVYWLHRFDDSKRLRLRAAVAEEGSVESVSALWKTANWMEREAYDMFGIVFDNHPGLERILTWEGFNGHPLRKDFPLEGIDTGAAIYPDAYPPGGGPQTEEAAEEEGDS